MSIRVLLYARATAPTGGGHVARCLTLLAAFQRLGQDCTIAFTQESEVIVPALRDCNCRKIVIPDNYWGHVDYLKEHCPLRPDLVVVDDYGLDWRFEGACHGWANIVAALDDIVSGPQRRHHDVELLSDETCGRLASQYQGFVSANCQILAGSQFALVDLLYAQLRERSLLRRRSAGGVIKRIAISMGLTDRFGLSADILRTVAQANQHATIDVFMGPTAPSLPETQELSDQLAPRGTVHIGASVQFMAEMLVDTDLAIGAGGTTSWLRCTLGVPTVLIPMAHCQIEIAHNLSKAEAAFLAMDECPTHRDDLRVATIAAAVTELGDDPRRLKLMSECASTVTDGQGAMRVAVRMYNLASSAQERQPNPGRMNTLIVVCTGNYYRSRFVEQLFNHLATKRALPWRAESRGLALWMGINNHGPIDVEMVRYLTEVLGIAPSPDVRMPLPLGPHEVEDATRILLIDEPMHDPLFREQFPSYAGNAKVTCWRVPDLDELPRDEALAALARQTEVLVDELSR